MIQTTYRKRIADTPIQQYDEWNTLLNIIQPNIPRRWVSNTPLTLSRTIYVAVSKDIDSIKDITVYRREYTYDGLPLGIDLLKEFALRKLVME